MKANDSMQETVSGECSTARPSFPIRFLGMGLLVAYMCCTHVTFVFPGPGLAAESRLVFDYAVNAGDVGMLLLLGVAATRLGKLSRHVSLCCIVVTLTCVGTLVVGLFLIPKGCSESMIGVAGILTSLGGALLFCLWAEVYAQLGMTRAIVDGALSCLAAGLVSFVVCTMRPPYAVIATSLLPALSLGSAWLSLRGLPGEPVQLQSVRYPVPWKLVAIMGVAGFLSGVSALIMGDDLGLGAMFRVLATVVAGAIVLVMMLVCHERIDIRLLAKMTLPLAVVALALIPFAQGFLSYVVSFLLKFAYVWFTFFVLLVLASVCYRFEVPTLRVFAVARASSEAAHLLGVVLRSAVFSGGFLENESFAAVFSIAGIMLVIACVLVWKSEASVNGDWGAAGVVPETNLHVVGPRERFINRCDLVAAECGLTARETEIMALIAQGKTRREIEQELFLSENTVKTHVRHIHAKLGTASKAEIIALFEDVAGKTRDQESEKLL